jgi:hypothetical protein
MKLRIIVGLLFTLIALSSCNSEEKNSENTPKQGDTYVLPPKQPQEEQPLQKQGKIDPKIAAELISVIKENISATEAKDKERVLKTIHKDCPQRRSTIESMDYVFAQFDLKFNLEQIEVLEVSDEDAKVYYLQTTQATRGEGFTPTRASGIHHMKKENGEWKIFKTEYLTNEPLM